MARAAFGREKPGFFSRPKSNKHGSRGVHADGHYFRSGREHKRYLQLKLMQQAGVISFLKPGPKWDIEVAGVWITSYTADFSYVEDGKLVVEDVKSKWTLKMRAAQEFQIKARLMEAVHSIIVKVVVM